MRNCLVENNDGDGFLFYLKNMNATSSPIHIILENCQSVGNRYAFRFITGNDDDSCVEGKVEVINTQFKTPEQAGISISEKPADRCPMKFQNCRIVDAAQSDPNLAPIHFTGSPGNTEKIGGVEFINCVLEDSHDRLPISYSDRAGGLKIAKISGNLQVIKDTLTKNFKLTQELLDKWLPSQAFKDFPHFEIEGRTFVTAVTDSPPDPQWSCKVRQRGHAEFLLLAVEDQQVAFDVVLQSVGRTSVSNTPISVFSPSGEEHKLPPAEGEGKWPCSFTASESGIYRIICQPGNATAQIDSCTNRIGLYRKKQVLHLLGKSPDLYFWVPPDANEFGVLIARGAERESVHARLYDPTGNPIAQKDNIIVHQFLVTSPIKHGIWRLSLDKPSEGVIEDHYIKLQGLCPLFSTSPEALLKPE